MGKLPDMISDQIGLQLYCDGKVREAIALWQQAIKIYQQQGSQLNLAKVAENLGNAYLNLQEYQQAIEILASNGVELEELMRIFKARSDFISRSAFLPFLELI